MLLITIVFLLAVPISSHSADRSYQENIGPNPNIEETSTESSHSARTDQSYSPPTIVVQIPIDTTAQQQHHTNNVTHNDNEQQRFYCAIAAGLFVIGTIATCAILDK